jgi:hypothetical protein
MLAPMSNSTNIALPFLTLGQAQKHVTINESLLRLDALVQIAAVSATTPAQPGAPSNGQIYILPAGKTGTHWGAMANHALAYYRDGVWEQISPREGWLAFVKDTDLLLYYTGAAWSQLPGPKAIAFSATDKILGRVSSGAGAAEEVTFTDQAQQLCDDASFGAMRATLDVPGLNTANTITGAQTIVTPGGTDTPLTIQYDGADNGGGPKFRFFRNSASPASGDYLGEFNFDAKNAASSIVTLAKMYLQMTDAANGSEDSEWTIENTVAGARAARVRIGHGLYTPAATGGDKGADSINAKAVYDDNTLLTCGPLELMNTGGVDLDKWDSLVPNIEHAAV